MKIRTNIPYVFYCLICLCISGRLWAQHSSSQDVRTVFSINDGWRFLPEGVAYAFEEDYDDSKWDRISLPHTWNSHDPFDDDGTYKRGIGWYRKRLKLDSRFKNKEIFLNFEGANQVADVYVNGSFAGEHRGGYTGFTVNITPFLSWKGDLSENVVAVQVNNAHNPFIPPLDVGYALYGGIYRDAWLIATPKVHFGDVDDNAKGIHISTSGISSGKAAITVKAIIANDGSGESKVQLVNTVYDASGKIITSFSTDVALPANESKTFEVSSGRIKNPSLWSPEHPYLYQVKSTLIRSGKAIDEVNNPLGFRWFRFDPNTGFHLNGKKYVLHGTTRHQDLEGKGSALSGEDHYRDMRIIKDMGCNFVRLAHYPQAPAVLSLADSLGLIIWEEAPVVNYMTLQPRFLHNSEQMIQEMIRQNYNHPSVVMWGSMNEILLYSQSGKRIPHHVEDTVYLKGLRRFAVKLDSTIRAEDPTRYSTMAMHVSSDYSKYKLDQISAVAGHNFYDGWYSGKVEDFGKHLDGIHQEHPSQVIFVSEYGAETDQRLNSEHPERMDNTGQYQRFFHESYLKQINARPYLGGTAIWNEFDFSQPNIGGTIPNINQKGMATWDRKPKDVYYLYKANWNIDPMVYIASRDWSRRAGTKEELSTIDVYANVGSVTLYLNGKSQGAREVNDIHKCTWKVHLQPGKNELIATGEKNDVKYKDEMEIQYSVYETHLNSPSFKSIAINVGSKAQYLDADGIIWIEDRPYKAGSFGYQSGEGKFFPRKEIVKGTHDVPLYYSYREALEAYKLDVPKGRYQLTLFFAEGDSLKAGERVFDVAVNGSTVIQSLDLTEEYGFEEAVKRKFIVSVGEAEGITIDFKAIRGKALLSGLKLQRLYDN